MSPPDSQARMSAYLDDALDPEEAAEFEAFLEDDPEARTEMEQLRQMLQLVGSLPDVEAPPDFYENLTRKMRRRRDSGDLAGLFNLVALPFQVLSILVIMVIAAMFMMNELDRSKAKVEHDESSEAAEDPDAGTADPPSPP